MSKLFDGDSDSDFEFKTDNEYAKNYDTWRKKEEINRLKTKYGEENLSDGESSSSSEDDEEGVELTEQVEKDFYKTLSLLKNKDPRIYDENVRFFDDADAGKDKKSKKKKEQPVFLKDYERKLILEKGGQLSDSDENEDDPRAESPTYVEEQRRIKENLKNALNNIDEDDDGDWGGLFKARSKTKEEKAKEEADYKEWLAGQKNNLDDEQTETALKPLKDYWNNPKLDEGEKFLRDYVLKKKFLDNEDEDYIPTYDEIVHDSDENLSNDEEIIEKQEEFEHKYNFRFEEPDEEFIKRYPRTMENSLRRKDDRRKVKRAETKERKQKEKEEKMQDIKKLKELKRKEIEEKISKLKEITGNADVGFEDKDIDEDFDPEEHDRRMQALFNDDFYQGPENEQKPEFPDIDEELEIENWERFDGYDNENGLADEPHCEDENFNMDCDYDPKATQKQLIENSKGKRKGRKKSKFAEAVCKPKPKFDPKDTTMEKYLDEYYQLDCEDIIGDIPCRFKYRNVIPNDFGLSTEEIIMAKDRELNKWCSLKKAVQIRPDHVEKYDKIAFQKKGQNINLKVKLLPSLFVFEDEAAVNEKTEEIQNTEKKNKKQKNKTSHADNIVESTDTKVPSEEVEVEKESTETVKTKKNKQKKVKENDLESTNEIVENTTKQINNSPQKTKKKKKKNKSQINNDVESKTDNTKKRKRKNSVNTNKKSNEVPNKKFKKNKDVDIGISDARLQAYGIKPKKFKNKLKYGNK